jgi:hypothetical protein
LIEGAERLVEEDEARLEHQRARDAHALAHAAGKLRRISVREIVEPHERQRFAHAALDLGGFGAVAAQAEGYVVPHCEPGKARVFLEDDADAGGDVTLHRPALEGNRAGARRRQPGQDFQQCRLAAAGRADDRHEFALGEVEIDRPQRVNVFLPARRREDFAHPAQFGVAGAHDFGCSSLGRNDGSTILPQSTPPGSLPTTCMPSTMRSMAL